MKFVTQKQDDGVIHSRVFESETIRPLALKAKGEMLAYLENGASAPGA